MKELTTISIIKMTYSSLQSVDKQRGLGRRIASLSVLFALVLGYSFINFDEDEYSYDYNTRGFRRSLLVEDEVEVTQDEVYATPHRHLAKNGPSPPITDVYDSSYIIKPVIGAAIKHTYETDAQTLLSPESASASTRPHWRVNEGQPYHVLDGSSLTSWKSNEINSGVAQYLEIDMGVPEIVSKVQIEFA